MPTFDENPILNSPYHHPKKHWRLDKDGKPLDTTQIGRRPSIHWVPIPKSGRSQQGDPLQGELGVGEVTRSKEMELQIVKHIRKEVDDWRARPIEKKNVTYVTQKFLQKWNEGLESGGYPLFFCQKEAAETLVWLNEVAPHTAQGKRIIEQIKNANEEANPSLLRYAIKMATGAGKTTVMAMMIAYHTVNKVRQPKSSRFCNHFLMITPGITIRDRLRVLYPNDPENYYRRWNIVPDEFMGEMNKARVVITNYHAFKPRETMDIGKAQREVLQGTDEEAPSSRESEGQMLERAVKDIMGGKDVIVMNDEAHHCYRHKVGQAGGEKPKEKLTSEEKEEVKKNNDAARLWISGIEALQRSSKVAIRAIYDLSATPFFLRGSGYREGDLFPWVVSDFSLMDAIECGIVKLPRVPVDDNAMSKDDLPIYRNLYKHVAHRLPRKGRSKQKFLDPAQLPRELMGALQALYSHYEDVFALWEREGIPVPPVFIVVCNNTSASKLIYDYIAGYRLPSGEYHRGDEMKLFNNIGEDGKPLARMNTLLIDSEQLESGEALSSEFKKVAAQEIEHFKNDMMYRFPERDHSQLKDEDLLREVMNTVGKKGKLGEQIRCVVSVSMLSEGWDANNVTHILGCRAFGTQLLCEQVIGRALRRYDYELQKETGLLRAEYADIFGVPFDFAQGTKKVAPTAPKPQYKVRFVEERQHFEIRFPRVVGYYIKIADEKLTARFDENSTLTIDTDSAPSRTENRGIIGESETLTLNDLKNRRENEVVYYLASLLAREYFPDKEGYVSPKRFRDLIPIVRLWLRDYVICLGESFPQYLLWRDIADDACKQIYRAITKATSSKGEQLLMPKIDPYNREGTTSHVDFLTRNRKRFPTGKSHISHAVCDSDWEQNFCKALEDDDSVHSYVHNDHRVFGSGLSFAVPYEYGDEWHWYYPDYIVKIDDGGEGLLNLVIEIKGLRDGKDKAKADTMKRLWISAVNNDGSFGRWDFVEITSMEHARLVLSSYGHKKKGR